MTDDQRAIEAYVDSVQRHLVASTTEKTAIQAELLDHLGGAAAAGELDDALQRLGPPERTAASFAQNRSTTPASFGRRLAAAAIDNLPLIAVTVAMFAVDLARGGGASGAFPPWVALQVAGACISVGSACGSYEDAGLLYAVGMPLALLWSIVGLGLIESRTGTTPGKRLLGLVVVTESGLRVPARAGMMRRTTFLLGPLAWLDWIPFLAGHTRRAFDYIARTQVIRRAGR